jgi:signal transduction histidine kinase/CheY-like chemotaxis protein
MATANRPTNTEVHPEAEEQRRLRVLRIVTLVLVTMAPFFVYQYLSLGVPIISFLVLLTVCGGLLNLRFATRRMQSQTGGWIATSLLLTLLVISNLHSGGFYDPNFGWLYVFPILAALLVDARAGWVFTGLVLFLCVGFWIASQIGVQIPDHIPADQHAQQSLANRLSAVIAIGGILAGLASQQRAARQTLEAANKKLQAEGRAREEMQQRLIRTERAASMGNLAAGLAHEINNPLTYVIGNLELLKTDIDDGERTWTQEEREDASAVIRDALEGASRVANLVRDLKTFSHVEENHMGAVEIAPVIHQAVRLVANELRHRARVVVDCEEDLHLLGSEGRLQQVLINLLVNAAHAIEAGSAAGNLVRVHAYKKGKRVRIEVSDTGKGIQPETLDYIFEPFFTTKRVGHGAGMGLFITDNVVKSFHGTLHVESTPGEGTTFTVDLPLTNPPSSPTPHSTQGPRPPAPGGALKILAVDDESSVLAFLTRALSDHHLTTETNPHAALERILRGEDELILCDLMMPEMTGIDLYEQVKRHDPELAQRMIFMTAGVFTEETSILAEQQITGGWIEKPIRVADLELLIAERLEARNGASEAHPL